MRITVRLFARLRDLAGHEEITCDIGPGATIADVWQEITVRAPALAPFGRAVSAAQNAEYARMTTPVRDGDEIAFLPPVSGGNGSIED